MENTNLSITDVIRTKEGIIVTFSNGDMAVYHPAFLHGVRNDYGNIPLIEAGRWSHPQE